MNIVDFLFVIIVLFSLYNGWVKGFILGSLELMFFIAGILIAFSTYPFIASLFNKIACGFYQPEKILL